MVSVLICERGTRLSKHATHIFGAGLVPCGGPVGFGELLDAAHQRLPQLVIIDLEDAGIEAVVAVEALMAERPTPILVVTPEGSSRQDAIKALAAGALDVIERPLKLTPEFWSSLHHHVLLLSRVSVVSHVKGRRRRRADQALLGRSPCAVVAIASSLGGPKALAVLFKQLPQPLDAAILVCQHITSGFSEDLARWLASDTKRPVVEATDGQKIEKGGIYIAPSGSHTVARADGSLELQYGPSVGGFRPACDVLLRSVAQAFGERAIGVVLTGMGKDGARGLQEIRARGGRTLAQDEATSVVFGMPQEAIALGGAEKVLPLEEIARQLTEWISQVKP